MTGSDPTVLFSIDFLLNVCAILFAFTAYASAPIFLNLVLIVPAVFLLLPLYQNGTREKRKETKRKSTTDSKATEGNDKKLGLGTLIVRPFLTNYRGAMLIETVIAILAVDFRVFPRRFAKVETWGTSLMDLGVGSFVFSAGIVSARAVIRSTSATQRNSITRRFIQAFRHSIPLLVLGIIRLISVKNLDYAEHVTEYGVHWNFFFTLGFLPPFVEVVDSFLGLLRGKAPKSSSRSVRYDVVALVIASTYEILLNNTSLLSFILIAPRTPDSSLLEKNREGIFSFIGYLVIFLSGRSTGIFTCQFQLPTDIRKTDKQLIADEHESLRAKAERLSVVIPNLAIRAVVFSSLYLFSTSVYTVNLTVSRRLANMPYVLWILAYNNAQLFLLAIIESFGPNFVFLGSAKTASEGGSAVIRSNEASSPVLQAFNRNGLAVFLLANLGTGLVNLTMNTLDMGDAGAMGVLTVYAGALTLLAVGLRSAGINIKL